MGELLVSEDDEPKHLDLDGVPLHVNHAARRYPVCIVWTPIHPISWLAPYVGHVGVCSTDGVVYDWTGVINRDRMAFGWPARYVQFKLAEVDCTAEDWDAKLAAAVSLFDGYDGPRYNFVSWNCHSFIVLFLNSLGGKGQCAGRWNLVTICGLFLAAGRFTSLGGFVGTWGPLALCYAAALGAAGWEGVQRFFRVSCLVNAVIILWFALATAVGVRGMHGRWGTQSCAKPAIGVAVGAP
ncbi:hypothetical protein KFE25_007436 [Diacronema lutheri]|uniref:Uncharacterized protein n=2 Tax=Diacronema lutheri TaxID=2081491 RepID=A0A8J5XJH0_DIALT|nr:hypothetical protein KFE25_007436 [Diacronema lutheri]